MRRSVSPDALSNDSAPRPPEASAEEMQKRLDELRAIARERPDASIYLSVKNGRARLVFPGGGFEIVGEGESLRIWPTYAYREELRRVPSTKEVGG